MGATLRRISHEVIPDESIPEEDMITPAVYQVPSHVQDQVSTQMGMIMGFITLAPPSTTIFAPLT